MNNSLKESLALLSWIKESNTVSEEQFNAIKVVCSVAQRVLDAGSGVSIEDLQKLIFAKYPNCSDLKRTWDLAQACHDLFTAREAKFLEELPRIIEEAVAIKGLPLTTTEKVTNAITAYWKEGK